MVKHMGFAYSDILNMPIYERRFYLNEFIEEKQKEKEEYEKIRKR